MATGTGNLPNQNMVFTPFDILTAEEQNQLVENIESLADGSGIGDAAIDTTQIADEAVTANKIDFTTFDRWAVGTLNSGTSTVNITGLPFRPRIIRFFLLRNDSAYAIQSQGVSLGTTVHRGSTMWNRITGTTGTGSSSSTTDSLIMAGVGGSTIAAGRVTAIADDGFTVTMSTTFNANWAWEAEG